MLMAAVFCYSEEDVLTALTASKEGSGAGKSKFDELLCEKWDQAMSNGMFRYDLSEIVTRKVSGKYGFIVQRNPKRHTHKRAPAQMSSLKQPFDSTLFNFNKIKPGEILFTLCRQTRNDYQNPNHLMIVNVSPITYGHTLFVPNPQRCLPQVLTEDSIRLCLEMVALSNHSGLCIVANSLLAYASVNHLHYHILYVEEPVLAAAVEGRHIHGCVYELLNHPSMGFGAELTISPQLCARAICSVVEVLVEMNVPHNMVILKGSPFSGDKSAPKIIKTILIPRKPHNYGGKGESSVPPPLFAAACELAQGFVPVLDHSKYETITEEDILQILQEMMLSKEEFQTLLEKVKLLSPN